MNGADVVDARPAQPILEVRRLEVRAERGAASGAVDGARVDDGGALATEQAGIARGRVESEDQARLAYDIDELLQDVRDPAVPHRDAEDVPVSGVEAAEGVDRGGPCRALGLLAGEDCHLGGSRLGSERREGPVPQVVLLDRDV